MEPYQYIFKVFAKLRWQRQGLLDLFMKEFPHLPKSVYVCYIDRYPPYNTQEKKINRGDITINGVTVKPTTLIRQHDTITHKVHRHEPPVTSAPIKIITMNDNIVVIDKPASIPVSSNSSALKLTLFRCILVGGTDTTVLHLYLLVNISSPIYMVLLEQ